MFTCTWLTGRWKWRMFFFVAVTTGSFSDQNIFMINLVKGVLIRFNECQSELFCFDLLVLSTSTAWHPFSNSLLTPLLQLTPRTPSLTHPLTPLPQLTPSHPFLNSPPHTPSPTHPSHPFHNSPLTPLLQLTPHTPSQTPPHTPSPTHPSHSFSLPPSDMCVFVC